MLTPTYIQLKYWIYPIGNTPAVNLLRDTSISALKDVRVLCLACGDPRSILFTLWLESGHARNAVLLTLIADSNQWSCPDSMKYQAIWNLFYHMLIPKSDLTLLQEHATKLVEASESLQGWLASSYGEFIQFTNEATLAELRQYWTQYKTDVSGMINSDVRNGISQRSKEIGNSTFLHGLRSAGPLWISGMEVSSYVYRKYWETGVAGGTSAACQKLGDRGKGLVNPMFAVSSAPFGEFAVHYGSEPLLGFHLVEAFRKLHSSGKLPLSAQGDRLVEAAKTQFNDWCRNFATFVENRRVCIQLFCGDAVALCHQLQLGITLGQHADHATFYAKPWKLQPLRLDGHAGQNESHWPTLDRFDVIDTSNLGDHIGLINMIVATAPLLRPQSTSILYTESLLAVSDDASSSLTAALGTDVATFSLLIGLAPLGVVTGTTLEAVSNEAGLQFIGSSSRLDQSQTQKQHRLRISWKNPDVDPLSVSSELAAQGKTLKRVKVDATELAAWFFSMYHTIFAREDVSTLFSRLQRQQSKHYSTDMQRYTRAAIVALIRVVKTNVLTDWNRVIATFYDMLETDRSLLMGSNGLQEFVVHLALFGVWTLPVLADGPRRAQGKFNLPLRPRSNVEGILGEVDPPSIVHIILSIPRKQLDVFTKDKDKVVGTPAMHVSVEQPFGPQRYHNCFYTFHCYFGKFLQAENNGSQPIFEEDDKGWLGSADLVIICAVPTFGLLMGPRKGVKVSLRLNTNPGNLMLFSSKLGPLLKVYEVSMEDERRVLICRNPPYMDTGYSMASQQHWLQSSTNENDTGAAASIIFDSGHRASKLQIRTAFVKGSEEAKALVSGASVVVESMDLFTVNIKLGARLVRPLVFPFPVDSSNSKTRIARKSSWIEVEAAIHGTHQEDVFDTWTKLYALTNGPMPTGSIPRVSLEVQPVIPSTTKKDHRWLNTLMGGMLSDTEKQLKDKGSDLTAHSKIELKESLNIIFQSFAGFHPQAHGPVRSFQLTLKRNKSCHTLIFASSMRHDLDLGSVVLDAWVLPLTVPRVWKLDSALHGLLSAKPQPVSVYLSDRESTLWKRMLPALAERCCTWDHKADCQYRIEGRIPLSIEENQNPLCSCGEGKVPPNFATVNTQWAPFAKYVTRIALAPVFSVPYVESILRSPDPVVSTAATVASSARCDSCNTLSSELKVCGGCGKARYCSRECQKAEWKAHKIHCKK
ncbi:MAG: hypothetical protein Q9166_006485 [cf. Caloplaca sp. 2 TL-2023]